LWLHSLNVAQLLRSAACLHTNQSRSYLNHLVYLGAFCLHVANNFLCIREFYQKPELHLVPLESPCFL